MAFANVDGAGVDLFLTDLFPFIVIQIRAADLYQRVNVNAAEKSSAGYSLPT